MFTLTLVVLFAITSQGVFSVPVEHEAQQEMANAILRTSQSMKENPERAADCFNVYSQGITAANEKYELEYGKCVSDAEQALLNVEAEVANDRLSVAASGNSVCALYEDCSNKESSGEFFECYVEAAGASITTALDMQSVSKTKMQYVNLRYQTIEYDRNFCSDESSNAYIKETTTLYNQLDECLKTGLVVSPPTPSSSSAPTEPEE
ncbi:uncharacterized protein LOC142223312 [Haematobia irritans]|uniref:Putative secreted protein n=1 Tax=Haematobia irritans TaxID=7368 RepID=A0A1L8EBU4_HAEIR